MTMHDINNWTSNNRANRPPPSHSSCEIDDCLPSGPVQELGLKGLEKFCVFCMAVLESDAACDKPLPILDGTKESAQCPETLLERVPPWKRITQGPAVSAVLTMLALQ